MFLSPLKPPVTSFQLLAIWKASRVSARVIMAKNGPLRVRPRNTRSPMPQASSPGASAAPGSRRSSSQLSLKWISERPER